MIDWICILDYSLAGAMLVMMSFGIAFSAFMPALDRWSRRYFVILFSLLFLCTVSCFLALIFWENPSMAEASKIVYFFEGLFLATPVFMPTVFLLHSCGESIKNSLLFKIVTALMGIHILILIVSQSINVFYYVTPDNQFFRGSLWVLWLIPLVVIMLLNITELFRKRKKLSKKYFIALLVYLLPMTVSIIVHMFLSVELFVSFDTKHTMFRVPPLTLQPLVENAVKHGMNPDGDPLSISVTTRQVKGGSEIIVENDGPDFNPESDNEPHIALKNIRERLEMMCKGKMQISPRAGGGTVVKVTIPASKPD